LHLRTRENDDEAHEFAFWSPKSLRLYHYSEIGDQPEVSLRHVSTRLSGHLSFGRTSANTGTEPALKTPTCA